MSGKKLNLRISSHKSTVWLQKSRAKHFYGASASFLKLENLVLYSR